MHGYPQFLFRIPTALAKFCFLRIVGTTHRKPEYLEMRREFPGALKCALSFAVLLCCVCPHLFPRNNLSLRLLGIPKYVFHPQHWCTVVLTTPWRLVGHSQKCFQVALLFKKNVVVFCKNECFKL